MWAHCLAAAGDKKLDREELKYGLRDYGVALSDRELDTVLSAFDKNKDGRIDFDEFLRGIRVRGWGTRVGSGGNNCKSSSLCLAAVKLL